MHRKGIVTRLTVTIGTVLYVLLCSGCVNGMFYHPTRQIYSSPASYGISYESVSFPSKDGTTLSGWFVPAIGDPRGTVIHFHGNAQSWNL